MWTQSDQETSVKLHTKEATQGALEQLHNPLLHHSVPFIGPITKFHLSSNVLTFTLTFRLFATCKMNLIYKKDLSNLIYIPKAYRLMLVDTEWTHQ